eukprot:CAMPEP_0119370458 /NCGR_PEP_ID=MMETSP1334-20130426/16845_1 /TAXON_ID=127549 /ORGANISM="Calcidiscus leptoporus, Strain RCC1130" /LENGTH=105 /DNA_ID=CAMNT_0007387537 /DNA_START=355 /DNA_END=670 /DNA_ORIENTATION=+
MKSVSFDHDATCAGVCSGLLFLGEADVVYLEDAIRRMRVEAGAHAADVTPARGAAEQNNEVVFDPGPWVENLPRTIWAVFFQPESGEKERKQAREVHKAFLEAYG